MLIMDFDPEKVREHKDDFTYFPEYVTPHLLGVSQCDMAKRVDFLEENGIKEEIGKLNHQYKMKKQRSKNKVDFVTKESVKWLLDHVEFHDCLIDD